MNKFIISEQEKNRILGMHKSRTTNHYLMEENEPVKFDKNYFMNKKTGKVVYDNYGYPVSVDGIEITDYETQWKNNFSRTNIGGRGFQGGELTYEYNEQSSTGVNSPDPQQSNGAGVDFKDSNGQVVGSMIF